MVTHALAVLGVLFIFYVIPAMIQEAWTDRKYSLLELIKAPIFTSFCIWAICHWLQHFNLI